MDIVSSGTAAWLAYKQLGDKNPELIDWKVDVHGNFVFNVYSYQSVNRDTRNASNYYSWLGESFDVDISSEEQVTEFIQSLPPKFRELVYCLYYDKDTKTETAKRLGVSRQSVYKWILQVSGAAVNYFGGDK